MKHQNLLWYLIILWSFLCHTTAFWQGSSRLTRVRSLEGPRSKEWLNLQSLPTSTQDLSWKEIWIDQGSAITQQRQAKVIESNGSASVSTEAERIRQGKSVIMLRDIVDERECGDLASRCIVVAKESHRFELERKASLSSGDDSDDDEGGVIPTLVRLPSQAAARRAAHDKIICSHPLPDYIDYRVQQILLRVCRAIDEHLPSLPLHLLESDSLTELLQHCPSLEFATPLDDALRFSAREPAINVYSAPGGEFLRHKDGETLTILLPLSSPEQDFEGGGTAFWATDNDGSDAPASIVLKPFAGTALLFGGNVTHAGVPVESGTRVVLVCSLSRRSFGEETVDRKTFLEDSLLSESDDSLGALLENAVADWHEKWTASELRGNCPDL